MTGLLILSLYAGAEYDRDSSLDLPSMVWVGSAAGVTILASEMVTLGGEDVATNLDVLNGDADAAGETITRGGSIEATGLVQITVSGGTDPFFHLNDESFIKTDALAVDEPPEGAASAVQIQSDDGIQILGVIQALDPDSDVTLVSGTGLLEIQGFVEAGDQLTLTGATAASDSEIGVLLGKLLYETRTELALTTEDEERAFTVDMNGDLIDDYGFLLDLDESDRVIVDEYGVAQRKIGDDGYPELSAGAVYITYDESDNPVTVDKEGYLLAEYEVTPGEMVYFRVDGDDRFLDDTGFVIDERGIRLDADGEWINQFGYLIDEFGNYINEYGNAIDAYGYREDQYGNLIDIDSNLISADGYRINEQGLLINSVDNPLNGVGAIRTVVDSNGDMYRPDGFGNLIDDEETIVSLGDLDAPSLADQYGNLVSDQNELIREIAGTFYLINERGELVDNDGVPLTALDYPVQAEGAPVAVSDPGTIEAPIPGAERLSEGSIQPGAGPMPTTGPVMVDLPVRRSGGVLNTTGDTGAITITTDKVVELHGMVGAVYMDEEDSAPEPAVDVRDISIVSPDEVYIRTDALVNARDGITIEGSNIWALDESVTIARDDYSTVSMEATGAEPDDGMIHIARSRIYYFRALVSAGGAVELVGNDIGVFGTVQVTGEALTDAPDSIPSRAVVTADGDVQVQGEIISAGDVLVSAGVPESTIGNIAVSAEGKMTAGYQSSVAGDIDLTATGEVILLAYNDAANDDLQFAEPYVTYEPVYVDVVTGYRRVEAGFILRPVVHWIPTITTEQTGFDDVKVGSEFGSVETRLFQDGYYNPDAPAAERFREYFIQGVDYEIEDLDWEGKYHPDYDKFFAAWLGDEGKWILPDDDSEEAIISRQLFEQVTNFADPIVNPSYTYAQGGTIENTVNTAMAGAFEPAMFVVMSPKQVYQNVSYPEVYGSLTTAYTDIYGVLYQYKTWDDLTDTEKVNAILDYTGYEKLFDMQFLSGFTRTVTVGGTGGLGFAQAESAFLYQNLTRDQIADAGASFVKNAQVAFTFDAGTDADTEVVTAGTYAFSGENAPMIQGIAVENAVSNEFEFVPGVFVNDVFLVTDVSAIDFGNIQVTTRQEDRTYFDFWFSEFVPFVPSSSSLTDAQKTEEALAHWLPPYEMLNDALADISTAGIPSSLLEDGKIAFSNEEAADYARIVRNDFAGDGEFMTAAVAQLIYNRVAGAISDLADLFFIAGRDYDEDYSNPEKTDYIASFFSREDQILADGHWEKVYSPSEGLGRINRNLEGIPTATFWGLDFTGETRTVEPYELDDGTDIFLRVPGEWWENYTVTALGNDRTEADDKTLQYVGNVNTYDETVGYVRDVAQLKYEQKWSSMVVENRPTDPEDGDIYCVEDYDNSPGRWVVTYLEEPDPAWTDEYTAYTQYSIFDGRETDEAILPYVTGIFTGLIGLQVESIGGLGYKTLDYDFEEMSVLLEPGLISSGINYQFIEEGDKSVKVEWTPEDWDLGDAGTVSSTGETSGFVGGNWTKGEDALGRPVYGQMDVNDILAVDQNGVRLEEIAAYPRYKWFVGEVEKYHDSDYYVTYYKYNWVDAAYEADYYGYYNGGEWHLAVINDAAENALVRSLVDSKWPGEHVWLGGYNINGVTHNAWSMDWQYGPTITSSSGYSNFHPNEPNNNGAYNDEDHLMMWPDGSWNDLHESVELVAVFERDPWWTEPYVKGEHQEDFIYKLKTEWEAIQDIRSDITYRVFTDAHDIVDKRPRYETLESEVPVIKMEQVTNWEFVPVTQQQLGWGGSVVTPDGPLDLSVFDLDTLSAKGNITITSEGDVLVKGSVDASGEDSAVSIQSSEGTITVGGDMPVNPMIYDMIHITATSSIELDAFGNAMIGETATLETTGVEIPLPGETDISITAGEDITIAGEILARSSAEVSAGGDVTVTGSISAANSTIEILAGLGESGEGGITVYSDESTGLGGALQTLGEAGEIRLIAGTAGGDVSLGNGSSITTGSLTLEAEGGTITQSAGTEPGDEETPPSEGVLIDAASLDARAAAGILLENSTVETIHAAVSGTGGIEIHNTGFMPAVDDEEPIRPDTVTLNDIETADGPITIETISDTLILAGVRSLTDSDDNDITITAMAAGTDGVALELHDVSAAGTGDVTLTVEGTIAHPDGILVADRATVNAFGTVELNTQVNELLLEIAGDGDLVLENTSADLTLEDVRVTNGNIDVLTHGNLVAQSIVLSTDWNTTRIPPSPNIITLTTAEGSGGTITVVSISGGTYAASEEEADAIRLEMLNSLLAEIDTTDIPMVLQGALTDTEGNPVLDEFGEEIQVVKLDLEEAQDLAAIVGAAVSAGAETKVIAEDDFEDGTLMTGHTAFLIFTRMLDSLGLEYEAVFSSEEGTDALSLLTLTKSFSSHGNVGLYADGAITDGTGGSGAVGIVADKVTLVAQSEIAGLTMAVNTVENAESKTHAAVDLSDRDGFGELSPGLEMVTAEGGAVSVTAEAGFLVGNAFSRGPGANLSLASINHNLFVKETGSSLVSDGDISLSASGDVILTGHVKAQKKASFNAGRYLSTFGQEATLEVGSLAINAGSTVTLSGHLNGLKELDVVSSGNVNLLGDVPNHKGLNVYVESVAQQQQYLNDLQANLKAQTELLQQYQALESALINVEIGQNYAFTGLKDTYFQKLVKLPFEIQRDQLAEQVEGMGNLLEAQSELPSSLEEMPGYLDLLTERSTLLKTMSVLELELDGVQDEISVIAGSNAEYIEELGTVQTTIYSRQEYGSQVDALLQEIEAQLLERGYQMPPANEETPQLTDLSGLFSLELAKLSTAELTGLAGDLLAVRGEVDAELSQLSMQEAELVQKIDLYKGTLAEAQEQLVTVQVEIADLSAQIADLDARIDHVNGARDILIEIKDLESPDLLDIGLRELAAYSDVLSPEMQGLVKDLSAQPTREVIFETLDDLGMQLEMTQGAIRILSYLNDMLYKYMFDLTELQIYENFDKELRNLYDDYLDVLSEEFAYAVKAFVHKAPTPLMEILERVTDPGGTWEDIGAQLEALSVVDGLLKDTAKVFWERFKIDQNEVKINEKATYAGYNYEYKDYCIQYEIRTGYFVFYPLRGLKELIYSPNTTYEQLVIYYSGLVDARYQSSLLDEALSIRGVLDDIKPGLPKEQDYLGQQEESIGTEMDEWWADLKIVDGLISQSRDLMGGEVKWLDSQLFDLYDERETYDVQYRNALKIESDLTFQKTTLTEELELELIPEKNTIQETIGTTEFQLAQLDVEEFQIKENFDGIVRQKWTERFDLGEGDLGYQNLEADFLRTAQSLRTSQGGVVLSGTAQALRDNLKAMSDQLAFLSNTLDLLRAENTLLTQQLKQAQAAQKGPVSVRIEALGLQMPRDVFLDDSTEMTFIQGDFIGPVPAPGGKVVTQDDFSGYYLYRDQETGDLFYRDVAGTPEDTGDDTFHVREFQLEQAGADWVYRDTRETLDDLTDDVLYAWSGDVPEQVYVFDGTYVVRNLAGILHETRTEIRSDTGKAREVTIESYIYDVHDYRYRFLALTSEPEFGGDDLYILDPESNEIKDFNIILSDLAADAGGGRTVPLFVRGEDGLEDTGETRAVGEGDVHVLYPGQELGDVGVDALQPEDILVRFMEQRPVLNALPTEDFTIMDPEEYSGTEVAELPTLFTEVLYQGRHLLPVVEWESGNITFSDVSMTASDSLVLQAAGGIQGLSAGEIFSADTIHIDSGENLYIGGSLLGESIVDIHTDGSLFLENTAVVQGKTVSFVSEFGFVSAEAGCCVVGDVLYGEAQAGFNVFGDMEGYQVHVTGQGDIAIEDTNTLGRDKSVTLENVQTSAGLVSVLADSTITALSVGGDDIELVATGAGSIELGILETWGSTVTVDAARYVRDAAGMDSSVTADEVSIVAGLDVTASFSLWNVDPSVLSNLSVLIDETYSGPFVISAERDIIVDAPIVTEGTVDFQAENILFTEKGAIRNPSGTIALNAWNGVQFNGPSSGPADTALFGRVIWIESAEIIGGENRTISADMLSATADSGFELRTRVNVLDAHVLGPGDLKINALSSIELGGAYVFDGPVSDVLPLMRTFGPKMAVVETLDGSIIVESSGTILARDVMVQTDRYSNEISLKAAGGLSLDQVVLGQSMGISLESGTAPASISNALTVLPAALDDVRYEGKSAAFHLDIVAPSRLALPDSFDFEVQVDFDDGSVQTIVIPYVKPERPSYGEPSLVIDGSSGDSWFGRSIAAAGDINGDGYADMVVGQGTDDRILVYLGSKAGFNKIPDAVIEGTQAGSGFGDRVSPAGDINGDGYDDVIVAAPDKTTITSTNVVQPDGTIKTESVTLFGQVLLYYGTKDGLSLRPLWTLEGFEKGNEIIVANAGDVNNDGYGDILVAEPEADVDTIVRRYVVSVVDAGRVQLFTGSAEGLSEEPSWTYEGQEEGGLFGSAVSSTGDVNGDGFDDVMIGARLEDGTGFTDSGRGYVFMGAESGLSGSPGMILEGGQNEEWFGSSIAAAGDVNHDGYQDVLVGLPGRAGTGGDSGAAYLYLGSFEGLGDDPLAIDREAGCSWFGWEVAGAGDVDGDGYSDILVRALASNGDVPEAKTFLFPGAPEGLSNEVITLGEGADVSGGFGDPAGSIAGLGDTNGDGFDDMAVGAWTRGERETGSVLLYEGGVVAFEPRTVAAAEFSHLYEDDGDYVVNVTVVGADVRDVGSVRVSVENIAPELGAFSVDPGMTDENGVVEVTGAFTDEGLADTHTGFVDWGDGAVTAIDVDQETRTFSASHRYLDDNPSGTPFDLYDITVTVMDDDGGEDTAFGSVTVHNLAPVITMLSSNASTVGDAGENKPITVFGLFTDSGTLDTHTATVEWGDGTITDAMVTGNNGTGFFRGSHEYLNGGVYDIKVTLSDDDGGMISQTTTAFISGARVVNGVLQIVGTTGDDHVKVKPGVEDGWIEVQADVFTGQGNFRTFASDAFESILVLAGGGNDSVMIDKRIPSPATMDGGDGNDHLFAGGGPSVLDGGAGDDKIFGSLLDDTIFGGHGNDTIFGNGGHDFIDGGPGDDRIFGGMGNDVLSGGDGVNTVFGGEGDDTIYSSTERDRLFGGQGDDQILEGYISDFTQGLMWSADFLSDDDENGEAASGDDLLFSQDFSGMETVQPEDESSEPLDEHRGYLAFLGEGGDDLSSNTSIDPLLSSQEGNENTENLIYVVDETSASSGKSPENGQDDESTVDDYAPGSFQLLQDAQMDEGENDSPVSGVETNDEVLDKNGLEVNLTPDQDPTYLLSGFGEENSWLPDFLTNGGEGADDPNAGIAVMLSGAMKGQATPPLTKTGGSGKGVWKKN